MKKLSFQWLIYLALIITLNNCGDSDSEGPSAPPQITTTPATEITNVSAKTGGNVTTDGGVELIEAGVYWATHNDPTAVDNKTSDGKYMGGFSSYLINLTPNTTYYVKAYATNKAGTSYGEVVSFTTLPPVLPTVSTSEAKNITLTSATIGGNITANGGLTITGGVCWSTSANPTIADNKTNDRNTLGEFTHTLNGLTANTTYYVRAYATNTVGTAYGNEIKFTTPVTDVDGNVYNTVNIGSQIWLSADLKTTKYRNGDLIGTTAAPTTDITSVTDPKYQWAYNGLDANVTTYGRLYTWFAVTDSRGVCPTGWHVPSRTEWNTLTDAIGGFENGATKLKEAGTAHWLNNNNATNQFGFTALPGGYRMENGEFKNNGVTVVWWATTTSTINSTLAISRSLNATDPPWFYENDSNKKRGHSVRCVKD